jgi:hypothetical protein
MAKELKPIDISRVPELLRIVEEVRESGEPRVLRRDNEDLAVVSPLTPKARRPGRRAPTTADWEAFRSSAGGWSDVDTDKLVADIYASRRRSIRPPVEL